MKIQFFIQHYLEIAVWTIETVKKFVVLSKMGLIVDVQKIKHWLEQVVCVSIALSGLEQT